MPYFEATGSILRMYPCGSRHSSSVGKNVGASLILPMCMRGGGSFEAGIFRETVCMMSGSSRRALSGMFEAMATELEVYGALGRGCGGGCTLEAENEDMAGASFGVEELA